jgi:hypothetical protein
VLVVPRLRQGMSRSLDLVIDININIINIPEDLKIKIKQNTFKFAVL